MPGEHTWMPRWGDVRRAVFLERPNRFLVRCRLGRRRVEAFLPNPGRLWELLLPGAALHLVREAGAGRASTSHRKTRYTVLAVERDGEPVFLHTSATNQVARHLLEHRLIPSLEKAEVVRAEVPVGHSRFDFLLRERGRNVYAEVKSCTLFGNGVAMFPDAVTERGRRHLLELADMSRRGARPIVLFLVHTSRATWFMPDYHTDFEFSKTLLAVRRKVRIVPAAITWGADLSLGRRVRLLDIPWKHLDREVEDRGAYLLLLRFSRDASIGIGALGRLAFPAGHYVYVGSATRGLTARIARHKRQRKRLHWHIDYLRREADDVQALPIRSSRREECEIAAALSTVLGPGPTGFGSSDCDCPTHLFRSDQSPLALASFHRVLQGFRMRPSSRC